MANNTVADKALQSLGALPFHDIIAGPLNACVEAQSQAAMSTVNFIKEVGLKEKEDGNVEAVYVHFSFVQGGRLVNLSVPLLTIVPIPYIAINTIDISFKAAISGTDKTSNEVNKSLAVDQTEETNSKKGWGILRAKTQSKMTTSVSSKRDSRATRDSTYSIEATIDVNVHASQDSMPAGMSRILEMLNAAVDLCSPDGEMTVSESDLFLKKGETASVTLSYKTPTGLLTPESIKINGSKPGANSKVVNGMLVLKLTGADKDETIKITVEGNDKINEVITVHKLS